MSADARPMDWELCEQHPDAVQVATDMVCQGQRTAPDAAAKDGSWTRCRRQAEWSLSPAMAWAPRWLMCTTHGAARLRARDRVAARRGGGR